MEDIDYQERYSDEWPTGKIQAIAHERTGGRCCWCLINPSEEVHHCEYEVPFLGKVKYHELALIGVSLFPSCLKCHKQHLHNKRNYKKDEVDVVFRSGNIPEVKAKLRFGYKLLSKGVLK